MNAHTPVPPTGLDLVGPTGRMAAAYVSHNHLPPAELPALLGSLHGTLRGLANPSKDAPVTKATPAEVARSIRADALISFEDGKSYKTLRRHLTLRGLSPEAYRRKWGLPLDYPMTCAAYSARRTEISRAIAAGAAETDAASEAEVEAGRDIEDDT